MTGEPEEMRTFPKGQSRSYRMGIITHPRRLEGISLTRTHWFEDLETKCTGFRLTQERRRKLQWVRSQMRLVLSEVEQRCITLYYFEGLNYREAAGKMDLQPSTVHRAVHRAIKKLRKAALKSRWASQMNHDE